jgi:hypothetical protein
MKPDTLWADAGDAFSLVDFAVRTRLLDNYKTYRAAATAWFGEDSNAKQQDLVRTLDAMPRLAVKRVEELVQANGEPEYLVSFFDSLRQQGEALTAQTGKIGRLRRRFASLVTKEQFRERRLEQGTSGDRLSPERFVDLTSSGPARTHVEVLLRGQAMIGWLAAKPDKHKLKEQPEKPPFPDEILDRFVGATYEDRIRLVLDDLLTVVGFPLGQGAPEARLLAAQAGERALEQIREHMWNSPMGWRVVRVVTELLRLLAIGHFDERADEKMSIERFCRSSMEELHTRNPPCLYRARSFFEEAAAAAPLEARWDWLLDALIDRATGASPADPGRDPLPVRERMYAAQVAYQRILGRYGQAAVAAADGPMRRLLEGLKRSAIETGELGLDYARDYIAAVALGDDPTYPDKDLAAAVANDQSRKQSSPDLLAPRKSGHKAAVNFWDRRDEVQIVRGALATEAANSDLAGAPEASRHALRALVIQLTLTVDGLWRRNALEAIMAAGLADQAVGLMQHILAAAEHHVAATEPVDRKPIWLVEHVTFCLGFLGTRTAVGQLLDVIASDGHRSPARRNYRDVHMTAVMAIGDHAKEVDRADYPALVQRLISMTNGDCHQAEERAALYALAMLRPNDSAVEECFERIIDRCVESATSSESDRYTGWLAQWGLDRLRARRHVGDLCGHCQSSPTDFRRIVAPLDSARAFDERLGLSVADKTNRVAQRTRRASDRT